jgi:DNA-binding transcriptional regulator YiaG
MTIQEIRKSTGLSQSKFAAALNIPVRTLQKWEIGERSCPDYVVELIAFRVQHDPQFKKEGKV